MMTDLTETVQTTVIAVPGEGLIVTYVGGRVWVGLRQVAELLDASSDHARACIEARHPGCTRKMRATTTWCAMPMWFVELDALRCWLRDRPSHGRGPTKRVLEALGTADQHGETYAPAQTAPDAQASLLLAAQALAAAAQALTEAVA